MLDMIKAMQDPEFLAGLQAMPQQMLESMRRIELKVDRLLELMDPNYDTESQQYSNAAKLQNSENVNSPFPLLDSIMQEPDSD